ncbi:MAG TPA: hypothetical protein VK986_15985 [Tepidisphaeraceae bacterium]|nr:hypothetical protein [Tepidisphaeraceae bacterium]
MDGGDAIHIAKLAEPLAQRWAAVPMRVQSMFLAGLGASVAIFWIGSRMLGVPAFPGFGGSLLSEPGGMIGLLLTGAGLVLCTLVGTGLAGWLRFDAGLWCAAGGMAVLSWRAGTVGDVLRSAGPAGGTFVLVVMGLELAVLFALVGLAWAFLWLMHRQGWIESEELEDDVEEALEPTWEKWAALGLTAAIMTVLMMLLGQGDSKVQAQFAVGVAALVSTCVACWLYPVGPSAWFWCAPLVVGLLGYVGAYVATPADGAAWKTGHLTAALAPLARALPLDYATAGVVGSLLGYWTMRKRAMEKAEIGENVGA